MPFVIPDAESVASQIGVECAICGTVIPVIDVSNVPSFPVCDECKKRLKELLYKEKPKEKNHIGLSLSILEPEYIDRIAFREEIDSYYPFDKEGQKDPKYDFAKGTFLRLLARFPKADVVELRPVGDKVDELIGMMRDFGSDCVGGDMCADCQFSYFCESGWTPYAIADKLVELANQAGKKVR